MQAPLTSKGEELLRDVLARHPGQSPAEIIEEALAEQVRREETARPGATMTLESFHAWLDQFTAYSDRIPEIPGETFSREMIYGEHD